MSSFKVGENAATLEPPSAALRRLFRASARALLQNRPLREVSSAALEAAATLSKAELRAVEAVGLSTQPWRSAPENDPLARSIVDYMALIETSLTSAQAAAMIGVGVGRVRQRLRERSLFGVEYEGEWRLPRFQFERNKPLPGLALVLASLSTDLNPLDVAEWFLNPNLDLKVDESNTPVSPRAWLLRGRAPDRVARFARHL